MFSNSIKETNKIRKETNRLLSKGVPNIYLGKIVTIEKNSRSQNFDFLSLKNLLPAHILGISNSHRYH